MNKKCLDERQVQKRNSIGNQTFILLLYLLLLDAGLYGFGFRWVNYPANIMIILVVCSGIYVTRLIAANAFVGPSTTNQKPLFRIVLTMLLAVLVSVVTLVLLKNTGFSSAGQIDEISAPVLFITAGVALFIPALAFFIGKIQDKDDE